MYLSSKVASVNSNTARELTKGYADLCRTTAKSWNDTPLPNTPLKIGSFLKNHWSPSNFHPPPTSTWREKSLVAGSIAGATLATIGAFPLGLIAWPAMVPMTTYFLRSQTRANEFLKDITDAVHELLPRIQDEYLEVLKEATTRARSINSLAASGNVSKGQRLKHIHQIERTLLEFCAVALYPPDPSYGRNLNPRIGEFRDTAETLIGDTLDILAILAANSPDSINT